MTADQHEEVLRRVMELEIRSAEQAEATTQLEAFVAGYESRVVALEREVARLKASIIDEPALPMPAPEDDLPPHY